MIPNLAPTHDMLSQRRLSFEGQIRFPESDEFATVDRLQFLSSHLDVCKFDISSAGKADPTYQINGLATTLRRGTVYTSGIHTPYHRNPTEVQIYFRRDLFRLLESKDQQWLLVEGIWTDRSRPQSRYVFYGVLQGQPHRAEHIDEEDVDRLRSELAPRSLKPNPYS